MEDKSHVITPHSALYTYIVHVCTMYLGMQEWPHVYYKKATGPFFNFMLVSTSACMYMYVN